MVKNQSRQLIFRHIFRNSPVTRAVIAIETGLSQGTVKTIVDEFLAAGIVEEKKDNSAPVGRKPQKVYLCPTARTFGVLHLQPGRADFHPLDLSLHPVEPSVTASLAASDGYSEELGEFLAGVERRGASDVSGVGVIVPGAYDPDLDRVICHIMPELKEVALREVIRTTFGVPVTIGEDVHVAALAEAGYPHNAEQPLFYLYAGSGVGGSYVSDGKVLLGATRMAGEIGQVVMRGGQRLEQLIRWPVFLDACGMPPADGTTDLSEAVSQRLESNDPRVIGALDTVTDHLSEALESMICILNPRSILIGGPYCELGDAVLERLRSRLFTRLMPEHRDGLQILMAHGGESGMIRGAAFVVLDKWLESEFSIGGDQ
jgi:predicted NBD/HSP70 family sugar kinase